MIYYSPVTGDPPAGPISYSPRSCFLMTNLGRTTAEIQKARARVETEIQRHGFRCLDAGSIVTGKDFLEKIWKLILQVPVGIALIDQGFSPSTLGNIFYELGIMQAYGKETLVIKTPRTHVPSDFVRTEYVVLDEHFEQKIRDFFRHLSDLARYYQKMATEVENNPFLAIDYLRRAYLLTDDIELKREAKRIFDSTPLQNRARNSVEFLFADFCLSA